MPQQMQYERIFWLEDNPNFLNFFQAVTASQQIPFDMVQLLERTTFAFDHEMGREIIQSQKLFDLYILDANFPWMLSVDQREVLSQYLEMLKKFPDTVLPKGKEDSNSSYYAKFWEELLKGETGRAKTILFSGDINAMAEAYELGLPFYSKTKTDTQEGVQELTGMILRSNKKPTQKELLAAWECGGPIDLIRTYLSLSEAPN